MDKTVTKPPKVSVVMSVYNGEELLRSAIDSILAQTFGDFEFIIIDDGSKDKTASIVRSYKDPRIRLISRPNKGLAASLKEGVVAATGEYVARMDGDDLSDPERFTKQVAYLDAHPEVALLGSNFIIMSEDGAKVGQTRLFTHPSDVKVALVASNQYGHGAAMVRRDTALEVGNYDTEVGVEDYDLWTRLSHVAAVANLPDALYRYRQSPGGITQTGNAEQNQQAFAIRDREFSYFRAHRHEYRLLSWHPDGPGYTAKKAAMFRDFAYLYRRNRNLAMALLMQLLATLCEPLQFHNYRRFLLLCWRERFDRHWGYEFL